MTRIGLITDSTAELSPDVQKQFKVHVIPLKINFGGQYYFEGELSPAQFFLRLETALELPTTSPPTPQEFAEFYRPLLDQYDQLISLHISGGLSETVNSARQAAGIFSERIHVVDAKTLSLGLGLLVREAGEAIMAGLEPRDVLARVSKARANSQLVVALDTLKYLEKGGRIGGLAASLGTFLNMKPLLTVAEDGRLSPAGRAFSRDKAMEEVIVQLKNASKGRRAKMAAVAHGAAPEAGSALRQLVAREFGLTPQVSQVGAVIGTHVGPGSLGGAIVFED